MREQLHGSAKPRYSELHAPGALILSARSRGATDGPAKHWGRGARFVDFAVGDAVHYLVALANAPEGEHDPDGGPRELLLERFGNFAAPVPDLIASSEAWYRTDILDRRPISRWGRGRVTLLGDAAHPMTPNTSQGAGMAIEDAVVLSRLVAEHGASADTLRAYERARRKRANSQIRTAHFAGGLGRWTNPLACRFRDKAFIELMFGGPAWRQQSRFISARF